MPSIAKTSPRIFKSSDDTTALATGKHYSPILRLRHRLRHGHIWFELSLLDDDVDIILPCWWMDEHKLLKGVRNKVSLLPNDCSEQCRATTMTFTYDKDVAHDPNALIIGSVHFQDNAKDPLKLVPPEFHQYLSIMTKKAADKLPPRRPYGHAIELGDGKQPPCGPMYALNEKELEQLRSWLQEMQGSGKIQRSKSSASAPIFFVPKPNGRGLRLCVDYRKLNSITKRNRYPLPLIPELQERISDARWFTKLDLKNGFHLIGIKEGDEWKTAFRCRHSLYEFTVMPSGLMNAPATFQAVMKM